MRRRLEEGVFIDIPGSNEERTSRIRSAFNLVFNTDSQGRLVRSADATPGGSSSTNKGCCSSYCYKSVDATFDDYIVVSVDGNGGKVYYTIDFVTKGSKIIFKEPVETTMAKVLASVTVEEALKSPATIISEAINGYGIEEAGKGEGRWVTIRGAHVLIGSKGEILQGPKGLKLSKLSPGDQGHVNRQLASAASAEARSSYDKLSFSGKVKAIVAASRRNDVKASSKVVLPEEKAAIKSIGVPSGLGEARWEKNSDPQVQDYLADNADPKMMKKWGGKPKILASYTTDHHDEEDSYITIMRGQWKVGGGGNDGNYITGKKSDTGYTINFMTGIGGPSKDIHVSSAKELKAGMSKMMKYANKQALQTFRDYGVSGVGKDLYGDGWVED